MAFRFIAKQFKNKHPLFRNIMPMNCSFFKFATVIKLEMPALSPTMSEGNITLWNKKEGD